MKLPNGENAFIDNRKLYGYCLNPDNPRGSNKARVFAASLGITTGNAELLRDSLFDAAANGDAALSEFDLYGQRYTIDFQLTTFVGTATVRSGWIILTGENTPRLTTCYVL